MDIDRKGIDIDRKGMDTDGKGMDTDRTFLALQCGCTGGVKG